MQLHVYNVVRILHQYIIAYACYIINETIGDITYILYIQLDFNVKLHVDL